MHWCREGSLNRVVAVLALVSLASFGCSQSPSFVEVAGKITLDGKPLEGATVYFLPKQGGRPSIALSDPEGHYELRYTSDQKGVIPGLYEVRISTFYAPSQEFDSSGKLIATPARREILPERYHAQSELVAEITPGQKVYDWELTLK
ncbi:carboxypeptidase-like regulatory domain-containing protein [Planctomicrobium sp. SH664]|uniref:carboxypeptidase-like regulatory domain-containing protein n=1 Tax=Planctomicrobium sp. SH664 TaxID=3448125 RepID=UPI003F5B85BE